MSEDSFIQAFFRYWDERQWELPDDQEGPDAWAADRLNDALADVDRAWELVLVLVEAADSDDKQLTVGVGPLTDFIGLWGSVDYPRILEAATTDTKFREVLDKTNGPWIGLVPREVEIRFFEVLGLDPERPHRKIKADDGDA